MERLAEKILFMFFTGFLLIVSKPMYKYDID